MMKYRIHNFRRLGFWLTVFAGLSFSSSALAIDGTIVFPLKTTTEVSELGQAIFEKDRAAWVATDELTRRKIISKDKRVKGWITEASGLAWRVSFVGPVDGVTRVFYEVRVSSKGKVIRKSFKSHKDGIETSEQQQAMFVARQTALKSTYRACTPNYNTVVLARMDGEEVKGYIVYLLAATTSWDVVQIGGHHRFSLDESGKNIQDQTALSNSCIAIEKKPNAVAYFVTEPNSLLPRETHVFISLLHEVALYVGTRDEAFWKVDGALIEKR